MSPLPREMRDRWANRDEQEQGNGTVYWHMLMSEYPDVQELAKTVQAKLAPFEGFHLTPEKWLAHDDAHRWHNWQNYARSDARDGNLRTEDSREVRSDSRFNGPNPLPPRGNYA
jgi:hypothetical protein